MISIWALTIFASAWWLSHEHTLIYRTSCNVTHIRHINLLNCDKGWLLPKEYLPAIRIDTIVEIVYLFLLKPMHVPMYLFQRVGRFPGADLGYAGEKGWANCGTSRGLLIWQEMQPLASCGFLWTRPSKSGGICKMFQRLTGAEITFRIIQREIFQD